MKVLCLDLEGNLQLRECHCATAVTGCNPNNPGIIKRDFGIDPNSGEFCGVEGIHLDCTSDGICELFIPCDNSVDRILKAYDSGKLDLHECTLVYDADDWDIY